MRVLITAGHLSVGVLAHFSHVTRPLQQAYEEAHMGGTEASCQYLCE